MRRGGCSIEVFISGDWTLIKRQAYVRKIMMKKRTKEKRSTVMFTNYMQTKVIVNLDKLGISKPITFKHYFELNVKISYLKVTKV